LSFAPALVPLTLTLISQDPPAVAIAPPVKLMLVLPAAGANVPPQVLVAIGVASTSTPAGKLSLTATPVTPLGLLAGLVMVMVSVEMPLSAMLVGAKALVMVGGAKTLSVALPVPPAPDSVVLTLPVVLSLAPPVVALTLTLIEQEPGLTASDPPDRLMLVLPAAGANVPPQVLVAIGVVSTSRPAGKLSLMLNPLNVNAFGLLKLMVSVEVPPTAMLVGEKLFVTTGGAATFNVAEACKLIPPSVELTMTLFVFCPVVVALTLTLTAQEPPADAIAPPVKLMLVAAATAVNVPPQVLVAIGAASTSRPAGKVSVKLRPESPFGLAAGLVMVIVKVEMPPTCTPVGEKAFAMVGGMKTLSVALAVPPIPPSVELTLPVVLSFAPTLVALTLTLIAQELPGVAIAPPDSVMLVFVAAGENVPPQVLVAAGVVSTSTPAGNVSLTEMPVKPPGLLAGLVMVIVSVLVPFT
jgi:hypothetical protein